MQFVIAFVGIESVHFEMMNIAIYTTVQSFKQERTRQAGAELCQAHFKLSEIDCMLLT